MSHSQLGHLAKVAQESAAVMTIHTLWVKGVERRGATAQDRGKMPGSVQREPSLAWSMHGCSQQTQAEVNFVTAFVPSDTACLASSPGKIRRTADKIAHFVSTCKYKYNNNNNNHQAYLLFESHEK